ncbi:glyoxylate/hydroxypyruvate reductase A [Tistlia consotensis]|uniref:Glyoxylate/hydroxypyruvate reductase A n=1 Tax=Tistlia consotensis USBA 355 TaxID=560819 RepID=A0A1Y6BK16_9PROT|nr:glyoxylate/hydroxypyruvate reductase A [Tistlia consotensis]SMF07477.1 glyoxylate/hydroxypyruvate reductase A [Tistlia consotensis USBA 355]SNR35866.1 glyoxylate/hydroxypyruvate reductase A [Tistlia consotensis]
MTKLLFKSDLDRADLWTAALQKHQPDLQVEVWPSGAAAPGGDLSAIDYALVWKPPTGVLKRLPNLKAIFSLGAGIDHIFRDPELPAGVPVVRMVERGLTAGMTEYVVMQVLFHHRRMFDYRAQQRAGVWEELPPVAAWDRRVGILGLGQLGSDAAAKLAGLRLDVAGWSRSPKEIPGVASYSGAAGLDAFLARTEILVNLLPLTDETRGILDAETFAKLPAGASLINVGRGEHLVEADLLAALESGQIDSATLDVFAREPLPGDSPFWRHERVVVTPHVASMTLPDTAAEAVVENIRRIERGEPPLNAVDRGRGY